MRSNTCPPPLCLRCDECRLCYHFGCLDPPLKKSPKQTGYGWICQECDTSSSKVSVSNGWGSVRVGPSFFHISHHQESILRRVHFDLCTYLVKIVITKETELKCCLFFCSDSTTYIGGGGGILNANLVVKPCKWPQ